jgi:hypothetical protein
MTQSVGYYVAVFAMDGSLVGVGAWKHEALSPKWLQVAADLVESATQLGRATVPIENLDHLELKLTRAEGASLATYYAHGILAVSTLLFRGDNPHVEAELSEMFVQSLCDSARIARLTQSDPFSALFSLTERPLHVVVPWSHSDVTSDDHELLKELSAHVAGAVLTDSAH